MAFQIHVEIKKKIKKASSVKKQRLLKETSTPLIPHRDI